MDNERAFEWNDEIENDSEFVLLPEGDYDFTVTKFERKRYTPGPNAKLPPCNQADVTLSIKASDGNEATIIHSLFLHSKCEGMLCSFFTSIGHRKHGERMKMEWNKVPGAKGRCKVAVRTYTRKDGSQGQINEIKKFYEAETPSAPVSSVQTTTQQFIPGAF